MPPNLLNIPGKISELSLYYFQTNLFASLCWLVCKEIVIWNNDPKTWLCFPLNYLSDFTGNKCLVAEYKKAIL